MTLDLYPARVRRAGERWLRSRAVLQADKLVVLVEKRGKAEALIVADVESVEPGGRGRPHRITLAGGELVEVERDGGCSCGGRILKQADWRSFLTAVPA